MKLDPLPPSGDEYWQHASTELQKITEDKGCDHFFDHNTALEVECRECHAGFHLSPGWTLREGKIYTPDGLVV